MLEGEFTILATFKILGYGLLGGLLLNLSYISWMNGYGWGWAQSFPLGWGGAGLAAMITFFHELGHTFAGWCLGYVTIPTFDFTYGGGMAWMVTDQMFALAFFATAGLLWLAYIVREHVTLMLILFIYAFFNFTIAFTDYHTAWFDFMGPAMEIAIASFFLIRAWMNIAPRGWGERFMNSLIGWGMIIHALLTGFGLRGNEAMREDYYNQKGAHGFGDFDKIAENLSLSFYNVVLIYIGLTFFAAVLPVIILVIDHFKED